MWTGFFVLVLAFIVMDLYLLGGRKAHKVSIKEAAGWSLFWVATALAFAAGLWWWLDANVGRELANLRTTVQRLSPTEAESSAIFSSRASIAETASGYSAE